jgi:predicted pyridoxine 5'-phosphate oxidase superfamily flavin-nucleotide-binding protein
MCEKLYQAVVPIPLFGSDTAPPGVIELIHAARDMPVGPYLDRLYPEAMGISTPAQRIFLENRKSKAQAQQRALRQRLRNAERKLAQSVEEISRLKQAANASKPILKPARD